jgi:hypothetical protein
MPWAWYILYYKIIKLLMILRIKEQTLELWEALEICCVCETDY